MTVDWLTTYFANCTIRGRVQRAAIVSASVVVSDGRWGVSVDLCGSEETYLIAPYVEATQGAALDALDRLMLSDE